MGQETVAVEANLADPHTTADIFEAVERELGSVSALVLAHCESVKSGLLDTSIESFDRHFAVNTRASWLLIREYARRFRGAHGTGRIVSLTSDATVGNLPYGASKGALDRITLAAAQELAHLGVTAKPLGRLGRPGDCANLVAFLCSPDGGWINGQLLRSDGGIS